MKKVLIDFSTSTQLKSATGYLETGGEYSRQTVTL
jgi:hypothetical protein